MTDDLRARIAAAVDHGLWFAEADPDSVKPETVNAVLAVVQPVADERDRLAAAIEQIRELCADNQVEAVDGGMTDVNTMWPSEILAILDNPQTTVDNPCDRPA